MKRRLQQYFITGLLVWLPMAVTVWILMWMVGIFDGIFAGVLSGLDTLVPAVRPLSEKLLKVPGLGVLLVGSVILLTGLFVANMFGQWWVNQWDKLMNRIPVVRTIYTSVKQVSDTLFADSGKAFSKALLIQFPRQGAWTIAFLTGKPSGQVAQLLGGDFISVYVPTTPNPTGGYFLLVPRTDVVELDMSVDDALKYIISMGVVAPGGPDALPTLPAANMVNQPTQTH